MKNLITLQNQELTMSSRDLLGVINEVRNSEGEKSIRVNDFHARVADELSDFNYETFVVQNINKTESTIFKLTQDMCMLVAMRESKKVRRIVLEQLKSKFTRESYSLPQTLPEALRLAAELAEERELLKIEVNQLKPKAEFHDIAVDTHGALTVAQSAKSLGTGRNRLLQWMRQNNWINRRNEPYQDKIEQGFLDVKLSNWEHPERGLQEVITTLITGKGLARLAQLINIKTAA